MICPDCRSKMAIEKTAHFSKATMRVELCPCGSRFETETKIVRRLTPVVTTQRRDIRHLPATGNTQPATAFTEPATANSQPVPSVSSGGVGGGLSSGSDLTLFPADLAFSRLPDPDLSSDLSQGVDPARVKPRKAKRLETPAFEAFYEAYPRKVARDAAWRMWLSKGCEAFASEVMAALDWQVPAVFDKAPADKIPHPASWLHDGRWKDRRIGSNGTHAVLPSHRPIPTLPAGVPRPR